MVLEAFCFRLSVCVCTREPIFVGSYVCTRRTLPRPVALLVWDPIGFFIDFDSLTLNMPTYHYKPRRANYYPYWVLTHPSVSIGWLGLHLCIVYLTREHSSIGSHVCTRPTLLSPTLDAVRISSRVCVCVCVIRLYVTRSTVSDYHLWEFAIFTALHEDELIRFRDQKVKGRGYIETVCGQISTLGCMFTYPECVVMF